jgi:hypothetical protein
MNTAELDMETSAELLPDRQALCCWKPSPWGGHEYSYTQVTFSLSVSFSYTHITGW